MSYRTDIAYVYDGSLEGLFCCVHESYYAKELPSLIFSIDEEQATLFTVKEIETDFDKADKVAQSINESISQEAMYLVRCCYFSELENRELAILNFLRLGYKVGADVVSMLSHDAVVPVAKAAKTVGRESNYYKEFLRFSDYNGTLVAIIEPKAFVLPLIADHYCDRLPGEQFLIYDKHHKYAFAHILQSDAHQECKGSFFHLEHLELPEADEKEALYRVLWKQFYDTIAVEGRINHKLRMNNMPKRYWTHITEFL